MDTFWRSLYTPGESKKICQHVQSTTSTTTTTTNNNNNKINVLFCVLFLQIGAHGDDGSVVRATESWSNCIGFESPQERRENFLHQVIFLCWLSFRYQFHLRVTALARRSSWSFFQKYRWQVTAEHTYTLHYVASNSDTVNRCMVVRCTQTLFWKRETALQPLWWNFRMRFEIQSLIQTHMTAVQWVCSEAEDSTVAAFVMRLRFVSRWGDQQVFI